MIVPPHSVKYSPLSIHLATPPVAEEVLRVLVLKAGTLLCLWSHPLPPDQGHNSKSYHPLLHHFLFLFPGISLMAHTNLMISTFKIFFLTSYNMFLTSSNLYCHTLLFSSFFLQSHCFLYDSLSIPGTSILRIFALSCILWWKFFPTVSWLMFSSSSRLNLSLTSSVRPTWICCFSMSSSWAFCIILLFIRFFFGSTAFSMF